jgi:hypothetical protein
MNLRKLRMMAHSIVMANSFGGSNSPFATVNGGQKAYNVFDDLAQRGQQQQAQQPPAGATDYVPSQSVPGSRVPGTTPAEQGGQLGTRVNNAAQSPLAGYLPESYAKDAGQEGGGQGGQGGQPSGKQEPEYSSPFDAKLEHFSGIVENQNFLQKEDAELAQKAVKGDVEALMALMNKVGQRATASASFLSTRVAHQGVNLALDQFGNKIPERMTQQAFDTMFEGPQTGVLSNPKAAAMAPTLAKQFREQYPKAPPAEIKAAVTRYLADLTGWQEAEQSTAKAKKEQGWDNFFNN